MASSLQQTAATITERSKTLINNDLKKILKEEGTSQTGNKAALQARVISIITDAVSRGDAEQIRRLQYRVQHHGAAPPPSTSSPVAPSFLQPPPPIANGHNMGNGYQSNGAYPSYQQRQQSQAPPRMPSSPSKFLESGPTYFFKESPFFKIHDLILSGMSLDPSPTHRNNISRHLTLTEPHAAKMKADGSMRLLLFSALEQPLAPYSRLDIAFPSQIEVKINEEEVKANYKGLKNKPGSTRPADITEFVRFKVANQRNNLNITYALTQKASSTEKYNLFIYLVKKFSVEELRDRIKRTNVISRQSVLNEIMKKANDPDIEVGSSVMSLKDPVSTVRIVTPVRSMVCTHNQCFDADSFLQLQEQAPTWTCPICNKTVSYESLGVDQYVEEILGKVRNADQVTIQPNGAWSTEKDAAPKSNGYGARYDESDDDLVDITDSRVRNIKSEAAPTPTSISTPPLPSRETSTAPRSNNKRTAEVVDLTLSDDDEPPRPAKKVAYTAPDNLPDPMRRYQLPPIGGNSTVHTRPPPPSYHHNGPSGMRSEYSRDPSTPPSRNGNYSYRPAAPYQRPSYPGQGTSSHPAYLGSSP